MENIDNSNENIVSDNPLPAILIGGPPNAGKSVLTYSLTRELRRRDITHFVFRANPDGGGDWFLHGNPDIVNRLRQDAKGKWCDGFRTSICRDLARRQLPLLVDLGGCPQDADIRIFQLCTHSILLLKDDKPQATETWRRFIRQNGLQPIAELRSQLGGRSTLLATDPILTGTITDLLRVNPIPERMGDPVFNAVVGLIETYFKPFTREELEAIHRIKAPIEFVVNLREEFCRVAPDLDPDKDPWSADLLPGLLASLPPHTETAAYGRAPNWVYGALAMHTYPQTFHQFDACINWRQPPALRTGNPEQQPDVLITLLQQECGDMHIVHVRLTHYYLDYLQADQLVFPEPPPDKGVVVSGKLPLWLFTALARFYADRHVPWIALNDASNNRPVVIYSRVGSHSIGQVLPAIM